MQGFLTSKANKTFLPFLFHLFSCFMHFFSCILGNIGTYENLGFLLWDVIKLILVIWFDQFDELGKIKISRSWNYSNWRFSSIEHKLMKLAYLIDKFDHYICYLTCLMINWSICWDFWKWVFKIWGFWYKLYVQANFVFLTVWTILNALKHASCGYFIHASYRLLFSILFLL